MKRRMAVLNASGRSRFERCVAPLMSTRWGSAATRAKRRPPSRNGRSHSPLTNRVGPGYAAIRGRNRSRAMARTAAAPPIGQKPAARMGSATAGGKRRAKYQRLTASAAAPEKDARASAKASKAIRRTPPGSAVAPARTRPWTRSGERAASAKAT